MTGGLSEAAQTAAAVIRDALATAGTAWEEPTAGTFAVTLPGTRKLAIACSLRVGTHGLSVNAFVARHPDENFEAVYRWLLTQNATMYGVAFALDHLGDIYLVGKVPLEAVTAGEIDRLLGAVLQYADESFNRILELGFATAIRKEWEWRRKRGEPVTNLAAFAHLTRQGPSQEASGGPGGETAGR